MRKEIIAHNKPTIDKKETAAIANVLKSGWLAEGQEVRKFEKDLCEYMGLQEGQAAAVSSGTAAIYIALVSLGVGMRDKVITPTYVCSAVLNAIYLAGAEPVLVDIDSHDFNISYEETKKKLSPRTKAIIIPHTFGMPADVGKFLSLGVPIVEDCAQAIGSKLNGKHVGTLGNVSVFSFFVSKVITTGYGGMVFSRDKALIDKVRDYLEFDGRRNYKPRFNFQMSNFQAAMGRVQLKKLPMFLRKRKNIANKYYKILPSEKVWPLQDNEGRQPNFYRFLLRTYKGKKIKELMEAKGIKTIIPIETYELLHRYLKQNPDDFPISEQIARTTLSLPIYPSLSVSEINYICTRLLGKKL